MKLERDFRSRWERKQWCFVCASHDEGRSDLGNAAGLDNEKPESRKTTQSSRISTARCQRENLELLKQRCRLFTRDKQTFPIQGDQVTKCPRVSKNMCTMITYLVGEELEIFRLRRGTNCKLVEARRHVIFPDKSSFVHQLGNGDLKRNT